MGAFQLQLFGICSLFLSAGSTSSSTVSVISAQWMITYAQRSLIHVKTSGTVTFNSVCFGEIGGLESLETSCTESQDPSCAFLIYIIGTLNWPGRRTLCTDCSLSTQGVDWENWTKRTHSIPSWNSRYTLSEAHADLCDVEAPCFPNIYRIRRPHCVRNSEHAWSRPDIHQSKHATNQRRQWWILRITVKCLLQSWQAFVLAFQMAA